MSIQSIVFTYAWKIRKEEPRIKNALREAWKRVKLAFRMLNDSKGTIEIFAEAYAKAKFCSKLRRAMKAGKVAFAFRKKDNSIRQAIGTALTPKVQKRKTTKSKAPSANGFYFDMEKQASRCFKVENLIVEQGFKFV